MIERYYHVLLPLMAVAYVVSPDTPDYTPEYICDSDKECEEATGYPYDVAMSPNPPKYPRLVGIDCIGASGPIYAFEEDHLPKCRSVFEMDWDFAEK